MPVVKALMRLSGWVGSSAAYICHLCDKHQTLIYAGPYLPSTMHFHPGNLNISIIPGFPFTKFSQAALKTVWNLISWPQSQTSCKRDFNVRVDQEPMVDLLYTDICDMVRPSIKMYLFAMLLPYPSISVWVSRYSRTLVARTRLSRTPGMARTRSSVPAISLYI